MNIEKEFSTKLKKVRKNKKLTQEQAAEELDISVRWYQKLESAKTTSLPGFTLCCKLVKCFGLNLADFADFIEGYEKDKDNL